jgi:hypothetical protein
LFVLLGRKVKVKMKQVRYSLVHKAQTIMASLVIGCGHTKAINETLEPERAAVSYLGLERFPDQSQVNRYLTRLSQENVEQLGEVQLEMMMRQLQARQAVGWVVVGIDQCGLDANGKTYEFQAPRLLSAQARRRGLSDVGCLYRLMMRRFNSRPRSSCRPRSRSVHMDGHLQSFHSSIEPLGCSPAGCPSTACHSVRAAFCSFAQNLGC